EVRLLAQAANALAEQRDEAREDSSRGPGVAECGVAPDDLDPERGGDAIEVVLGERRERDLGEGPDIEGGGAWPGEA
ncbi:MAG TPA: hypothetical protein PK264_11590, partial [Hyphomicrobiaceae bacterium]|nr:hypothetical protein [Hyphomicrobiaceae bacterium]